MRYHFHYGRFYDPFYFGFDNSWTDTVTTTPSYLRQLSLNIVSNDTERTRLFEGRVRSTGRQGELALDPIDFAAAYMAQVEGQQSAQGQPGGNGEPPVGHA